MNTEAINRVFVEAMRLEVEELARDLNRCNPLWEIFYSGKGPLVAATDPDLVLDEGL